MMKKLMICIVLLLSVTVAKSQALNDSIVMAELIKQGIQHPEIVLAQAKLETGNYKSTLCVKYGNLFGLNSRHGYRHYKNWKESVTAYKVLIQSRYKGGDYYAFLRRIRYASNPNYTQYLKKMVLKK